MVWFKLCLHYCYVWTLDLRGSAIVKKIVGATAVSPSTEVPVTTRECPVGLAVDDDMSVILCGRAISSQDGNWGRNTYGSPTSVTAIISFSSVDMVKSVLQLHGSSFKPFVHITWLYNQWHILVYLVALTGVVQSLLIFMFYAVVSRIYAPLCVKAPLTFLAKVPAQVFLSRV